MGLDRAVLLRSAYGAYGQVANAPVSQAHWTWPLVARWPSYNPAEAAALLERRGWTDRDGDGYREKDGVPLTLRLNVLTSSSVRLTMAPQIQEQLRRIGVRVEIIRIEGPVYGERRQKGEFDIDFNSPVMDPSPSGIVQSWSCAGRSGSNVGQYCNPTVDSLIDRAILSTGNTERNWREAYAALQHDVPAVFLVSPTTLFAVHTRYRGVTLRRESLYSTIWQWSVDPSRRIARDGPRTQ
jgi:peptide/nickel transport system substrate-binding protein